MLLLALALGAAPPPQPAPCGKPDTISISECGEGLAKQADASLNRYYQAALRRLQLEGKQSVKQSLTQAQRAWIAYRDDECKAVYEDWIDGSLRSSMEESCIVDLTKIRTYVIWRDWLKPVQGEPILPRPDFSSVTREDETP